LLLEGPDIEALLAQIRDEHGSAARIVSADKVRRGGVGGFFARQRFEIAVELDDGSALGASARDSGDPAGNGPDGAVDPRAVPAATFTSLVDRADAAERRLETAVRPAQPAAGRPVPPPAFVEPPPVAGTDGPTPAPAEEIAFTDLLASLRAGTGQPSVRPALPPPYRALTGGPADPGPVNGQAPVPAALGLAALSSAPAGVAAAGPVPAGSALTPLDHRAGFVPAVMPGRLPAELAAQRLRGLAADLVGLGVPAEYARLATGPDRFTATLQAMAALPVPPAPPAEPGDLLVLLGDPGPATELATRLAETVQGDAGRIMVAAPTAAAAGVPAARRILGPDDAARRGRRLHIEDLPHVVVVAAPVDGSSGDWVRAVTRALRPTAVWALVDCTRKTGDLTRHLATLGPLDAIALHGTPASADPATVQQLGLPVAYLDGRPATAGRWAGLLCALLADPPTGADPPPAADPARRP
jgi:hypothetical protein